MGVRDYLSNLLDGPVPTTWSSEFVARRLSVPDEDLATFVGRLSPTSASRTRPWRVPSVQQALGVPAIQRAVTLISNTTGALTVQAFRNSEVMAQTPAVVARPDPYSTPRDFYRDSAYNLATRGECVWWIASRDSDNRATALVVVPLHELDVKDNKGNRALPQYKWGDITGTRYTPASPQGKFVHVTYLKEPGHLRGVGPLQLGRAAASVAVEAQEWAANFYGEGGNPSLLIKASGQLGPEQDADGYSEADRLRNEWMGKPHNVPRVIDEMVEDVKYLQPSEGSAQALKSRDFQTGEAARLFGIPGALLEYGVAGASLTYQNLADVWLNFVRGCLAPNYLEPIEQAMADLLPRSTVTRFLTSGLYRADAEARWRIYEIMSRVLGVDRAAELAQIGEDLAPGNPETAPVPFAPPAAIPVSIPRVASTAMREVRCPSCSRLVIKAAGPVEGWCRHCKTKVAA